MAIVAGSLLGRSINGSFVMIYEGNNLIAQDSPAELATEKDNQFSKPAFGEEQ